MQMRTIRYLCPSLENWFVENATKEKKKEQKKINETKKTTASLGPEQPNSTATGRTDSRRYEATIMRSCWKHTRSHMRRGTVHFCLNSTRSSTQPDSQRFPLFPHSPPILALAVLDITQPNHTPLLNTRKRCISGQSCLLSPPQQVDILRQSRGLGTSYCPCFTPPFHRRSPFALVSLMPSDSAGFNDEK